MHTKAWLEESSPQRPASETGPQPSLVLEPKLVLEWDWADPLVSLMELGAASVASRALVGPSDEWSGDHCL